MYLEHSDTGRLFSFYSKKSSSLNLLSDIHRRICFLSLGLCDIETSVSIPLPSTEFQLKAYVPVFGAELPAIPALIKSSAVMLFPGGTLRHIFMPGVFDTVTPSSLLLIRLFKKHAYQVMNIISV
jgi:hypothetical protein